MFLFVSITIWQKVKRGEAYSLLQSNSLFRACPCLSRSIGKIVSGGLRGFLQNSFLTPKHISCFVVIFAELFLGTFCFLIYKKNTGKKQQVTLLHSSLTKLTNKNKHNSPDASRPAKPNIFNILKPYKGMISVLLLFALLSNSINLVIPKIISHGIDSYGQADFSYSHIILLFLSASLLILIFAFLQSIFQTYASERVARDLRSQL